MKYNFVPIFLYPTILTACPPKYDSVLLGVGMTPLLVMFSKDSYTSNPITTGIPPFSNVCISVTLVGLA